MLELLFKIDKSIDIKGYGKILSENIVNQPETSKNKRDAKIK